MTDSLQSHSVPLGNGLPQKSKRVITEADVLITAALVTRPARQPDLAAENRALHTLAQQLTDDPQSMLKTLVRIAKELCPCDTAGVSLLETLPDGTSVFRWVAIAGALEFLEQTTTPGNFSPCGTTIRCGQPQLYARPERYFTYLHHPHLPIVEGLLFPLCVNNQQLGTIWIISHNEQRRFDREDQRLMTGLAGFTAAVQSMHQRQTAEFALQREQATRQALDEAAQRAVDILESITDAFVCLDREWRITYVNQEAAQLNNLQPEEMIGKTHWEMWPWSVGTIIEQTYRQVVADQVAAHFEVFYEPLKMWVEIHAYPCKVGLSIYFRDITERKQAENALREREEFNHSVFESSADCLIVLDFNGCLLSINSPGRCLMEIEDCTPLVSTSWIEFWQDSDRAKADKAVNTAQAGGTSRFSGYCPTAKGTPKWWDVVVTPILDVVGKPKQLLVASRDITDRKQIEEALRQSEERFQLMSQATNDVIWDANVLTHEMWWSDRVQLLFGYRPEDLGPDMSGWAERVHPDDLKRIHASYEACLSSKESLWSNEYRFRRADGSYAFVLDRAHIIRDPMNSPTRVVGAMADISDRKQAEEALRESESRLRLALESAELGTWDFNPITGVLKWDDQCKAMFGLSSEAEIDYDVFLAGLHPEDRDRTNQVVLFSLDPESGGEYDIEYRTVGIEDGVERWIAAKGKAFFNSAGVAIRFIGTVLNITEKKRAEAEREQILQREQAAREQAETANRIKDEFLAVLSHELRSPLNPILGWSRLLQNGKLDAAKTAQALATIERNAKLQSKLIEDLLDVSRILQGKLSLSVSPIDLASTIRAALETVRLAAEAKSIAVEVSLAPNVSSVLGDSTRLQQVVWNLLSNAVKFTPTGGRVEVRLEQLANQAEITVRDDGKGIPAEFLPYVFDYFRQADSATTRKFGGLGLGLAIVRHLVELHGGTVEADSPGEGLGATFTVRLPLMPMSSAANQAEQFSQSFLNLQGVKVLVVDDDIDTREFVVFLLEQAEASVISATSASEALAALTQSKPDILLSDIGMPEMDGYMLIRQVRALPPEQGGQIPAIAITAYAGDFNEKQALAAGFQRHVAKPVEPDKLVQAIVTLL